MIAKAIVKSRIVTVALREAIRIEEDLGNAPVVVVLRKMLALPYHSKARLYDLLKEGEE